jgi:hypothetical protein
MRKRGIIKMIYGSTMFGKLWEWIMGIIAWIMSKFTRISVGGDSAKVEPETQTAGGEADAPDDSVPEPVSE